MNAASAEMSWMDDGTPYSARFDDRYHSHQDGGISQSRGSFLLGCGLPLAWAHQASWRVLETGFGLGLNFLVTWQAWRDDPNRPAHLHFISTEAWPVDAQALVLAAQQRYPSLLPLARELAAQYVDMHTGIHRIDLDQNRVHLTLAIGDAKQWLHSEHWQADSVYLDGFSPAKNPDIWSLETLKAVARCCITGHTQLATWCVARNVRDALEQCGFQVERVAGTPPKKHNLRALYDPAWVPKKRAQHHHTFTGAWPQAWRERIARHCIVIGAGIAGASMARAMAERGWQVTVLDQHPAPAQGASALPVGLFAPHISADDAPLSRLTREGIRCTRRTAARLLQENQDWQTTGVLEHRIDKKIGLPHQPPATAAAKPTEAAPTQHTSHISHASSAATLEQMTRAGLAADAIQHPAVWHAQAGWIKPAALVQALLQHPLITLRVNTPVTQLEAISAEVANALPTLSAQEALPRWRLHLSQHLSQHQNRDLQPTACNETPELLEADCVIIAAAYDSLALGQSLAAWPLPLNAVRGQVAWGEVEAEIATTDADDADPTATHESKHWPQVPVNGKGSFVYAPSTTKQNPSQPKTIWVSGGTFERQLPLTTPDANAIAAGLAENRARLPRLMPAMGHLLQADLFDHGHVHTWSAVRCTVPDRTPLYGPIHPQYRNVWVATGLGSRGLTLACLCAEALVAQWHDEPLPISQQLASLIFTTRLEREASK